MNLKIRDSITSPEVRVAVGEEERVYARTSQPFVVGDDEGERMLATGHFEVVRTVALRFKEDVTSPVVDVMQGEYRARFERAKQPFIVEEQHASAALGSGLLEVVPEEQAPAAQQQQEQQEQERLEATRKAELEAEQQAKQQAAQGQEPAVPPIETANPRPVSARRSGTTPTSSTGAGAPVDGQSQTPETQS